MINSIETNSAPKRYSVDKVLIYKIIIAWEG